MIHQFAVNLKEVNMSVYQNKVAFFQPAHKDTTIKKQYWVKYQPIAPVKNGSVVEFTIPPTNKDMIELGRSKLYVSAKLVRTDGLYIDPADVVTSINLIMHSLWRQTELLPNQRNVGSGTGVHRGYKHIWM